MKIVKHFLFSLLISFCESGFVPCKDCVVQKTGLPMEELKELRHEYLKNKILRKLHLTEPPKINLPKPPLKSLLMISEMVQNNRILETDNEPKTNSIVIFPKNESLTFPENESHLVDRFEFSIPRSLLLENFSSGEVWIYQSNKTIRAYQVIENDLQNTTNNFELGTRELKKSGKSWNNYNILDNNFLVSNASECILVIDIIDNGNESYTKNTVMNIKEMPFLVIRSKVDTEKSGTRNKRSSTCVGNNPSCCKEDFYLNFSEIGWDNWILHPDGYQANFCRGRCFNDLSNTRFYHSAVLLSFINDNKDIAEEIGLGMCCTPSVMAPLTIFYRNEEQLIYQKSIDNMRVEACDCA